MYMYTFTYKYWVHADFLGPPLSNEPNPLCGSSATGLSGVVDTVVEGLGPPEGVGVVKLEQVDALPRVGVGPGINLFVTIPPSKKVR
jgi:hypothetical protein